MRTGQPHSSCGGDLRWGVGVTVRAFRTAVYGGTCIAFPSTKTAGQSSGTNDSVWRWHLPDAIIEVDERDLQRRIVSLEREHIASATAPSHAGVVAENAAEDPAYA